MAVKVNTVDRLQKYFLGVVNRSDHHAPLVKEIIYSLLGIIIFKKDSGTDIEVRGNDEDATGNILWVTIQGNRYALRYEHNNGGLIEIRQHSYNGQVILTVTNSTPVQDIINVF